MLKTLDVLIGLSVVMLVLSMIVTMITQALLQLRETRGKHLLSGLTDLLRQLDPDLKTHAEELARKILNHQLIREAEGRLGTVIQREELTRLLLEFASQAQAADPTGTPAAGSAGSTASIKESAEQVLLRVLRAHNVANPAKALQNIRSLAVELERTNPGMAANVRQNLAILNVVAPDLLGKVNTWFDKTMDRVTERFTLSARTWTLVVSFLVVLVTQVDTISIVNRLAMDDEMRQALVREAVSITEQSQPQAAKPSNDQLTQQYYRTLGEAGILHVPSLSMWKDNWANVNMAGMVISMLLLSLGAPFWYNALSKMIRLRSVLADKDDVQRSERESFQPATGSAIAPAQTSPLQAAVLAGERGDVSAVG